MLTRRGEQIYVPQRTRVQNVVPNTSLTSAELFYVDPADLQSPRVKSFAQGAGMGHKSVPVPHTNGGAVHL